LSELKPYGQTNLTRAGKNERKGVSLYSNFMYSLFFMYSLYYCLIQLSLMVALAQMDGNISSGQLLENVLA